MHHWAHAWIIQGNLPTNNTISLRLMDQIYFKLPSLKKSKPIILEYKHSEK